MKNESLLVHSNDHCKVCGKPVGIGYIVDRRTYCVNCFNTDQDKRFNEIILTINGTIKGIDGSKL